MCSIIKCRSYSIQRLGSPAHCTSFNIINSNPTNIELIEDGMLSLINTHTHTHPQAVQWNQPRGILPTYNYNYFIKVYRMYSVQYLSKTMTQTVLEPPFNSIHTNTPLSNLCSEKQLLISNVRNTILASLYIYFVPLCLNCILRNHSLLCIYTIS